MNTPIWLEIRFALRALLAKPLLSLVILITLTLAIGANTTIFSFLKGVLLEPLPYKEADRLMVLEGRRDGKKVGMALADIEVIKRETDIFETLATFYEPTGGYNMSGDGRPPKEAWAMLNSSELFDVLGIPMIHGTTWPVEDNRTRSHSVVLTHKLFLERYNGDPSIVGTKITLDGRPYYKVYGVLAPEFDFPGGIEIYRSMAFIDLDFESRRFMTSYAVGRLRAGISEAEARRQLAAVSADLSATYPETHATLDLVIIPLKNWFTGDVKPYLVLVSVGVSLILLLACVNISGLFLIRNSERSGEMAVRGALGATRFHLMREQMWETLILALTGGVLGLWLSQHGIQFLKGIIRTDLPFWMDITIDNQVLLYSLLISVGTGLAVSATGWIGTGEHRLSERLKEGVKSSADTRQVRLGRILVGAEVATATVLLIGSALMVRSFGQMVNSDMGFNPDQIITYNIFLSWGNYETPEQRQQLFTQVQDGLRAHPDIQDAGINSRPPFVLTAPRPFTVEGQSLDEHQTNPQATLRTVSGGYFRTLEIGLLEGRNFDERDRNDGVPVAIISKDFAERMWPRESPIGKRIKLGSPDNDANWREVVGVVNNLRDSAYALDDIALYLPNTQSSALNYMVFVRTALDSHRVESVATQILHNIDPDQSNFEFKPYQNFIEQGIWQKKLATNLFSLFGLLALVLAIIGVYAMIAYTVDRRQKELGIRIALGAEDGDILGDTLGDAAKTGLLGVLAGVLIGLTGASLLGQILYGTNTRDPLIFTLVPIFLLVFLILAAMVPARRALSLDPVELLREE